MKKSAIVFLTLMSLQAFGAEIKTCSYNNKKIEGVVVPGKVATESIQKVLSSNKSSEEKAASIKSLLYIEGISLGDGSSLCEVAVLEYGVTEEKCMKVLRTNDVISQIMSDYSDVRNLTLECQIGLEIGVQLGFKM